MYKKITYFVLIAILFFPFNTFAIGQCKIANWPDKELLNYIENIRKIVSNTTSEIITVNPVLDITKDYNKTSAIVTWLYNKSISWWWYYSSWDYYIVAPLTSKEIPYEIKRDNILIEKEIEGLSKFLNKIISNWTSDIIIKNTCKWVKINNCSLNNTSAKYIIWELLKDTTSLSNMYKLKILWKQSSENIKFWWPKFNEIWNSYNPEMVSVCSQEKGMGKTISESIARITNITNNWTNWIQLWKDAIDLMLWRNINNYEETEKKILKRELSRQGVKSSNKAIIIWNLEKYNRQNWDWWAPEKDNFIEGSYNTITQNIWKQYNSFKKDILSPFQKQNTTWNTKQISKSIKTLIDLWQKNDITTNIVTRISEVYQNEAMFSRVEDTNTQKLQWKLFSMHINLLSAINKLNKLIPISEKVCRAQDNWNWLCTTK